MEGVCLMKKSFMAISLAIVLLGGCGSTKSTNLMDVDNNNSLNRENNNTLNDEQNGTKSLEHNTTVATIKSENQKKSFDLGESVSLEATVNNDVKSYEWSENGSVLGRSKELYIGNLNPGDHEVTLKVIDNDGKTATAIFVFTIKDTKQNDFKAKTLTDSNDHVLVDKAQNLMWVSEKNETKEACLAMPTKTKFQSEADDFCENLVFAGFNDWATPTTAQLQDFVVSTIDQDILPGYTKPCPLLLSKDTDGHYKGVTTRYNKTYKPGEITDISYPIGLRCVRSFTHTDPIADAGGEITVDYIAEFSFDASGSKDEDGQIVKYEWIFHDNVLNSDTSSPVYTRDATQPPGDYSVKLRVTDDDGNIDEDYVIVHVQ